VPHHRLEGGFRIHPVGKARGAGGGVELDQEVYVAALGGEVGAACRRTDDLEAADAETAADGSDGGAPF
jgi:hypothetical protein